MKKKLLVSTGVVFAVLIVLVTAAVNGLEEGAAVSLKGISLQGVPDGSYTGVYEFKRWSNTVSMHVENEKITSIDMVKDVVMSDLTDASEEIFKRVIDAQNTDVDAVSGATVTSKAYLKAIENALESAHLQ